MRNIPFDAYDEIDCEYLCDCSRERMLTAIARVGEGEILSMLDEEEAEGHDRSLEAVCRFCNSAYRFPEKELLAAAKKILKK
jgi:molecular chaperone Hsp33